MAGKQDPSGKDTDPLLRIADGVEKIAEQLKQLNCTMEMQVASDLSDGTLLQCNVCEKDFDAGDEAFVRAPGGDVFCVPCFQRQNLSLIKKGD